MNFDQAIAAHSEWKLRLVKHLQGQEALEASTVRRDNACPLGQWIHGEGRKFASEPEYQSLIAEHAKFHQAAAAVIEKAQGGDKPGAEAMLAPTSEFGKLSTKVVLAIHAIKRKAT